MIETLFTMHMSAKHLNTESVLRLMMHTTGLDRFIYVLYFIIGTVFYGMGFVTGYGVLVRVLNPSIATEFSVLLFVAYTIINCIIGYGFIYHRRWLFIVFTGSTALMLSKSTYFFFVGNIGVAKSLYLSIALLLSVSLFLFVTKKVLVGNYFDKVALSIFFIILLFSFWIMMGSY